MTGDFNTYLRDNGFSPGTYFDGQQARSLYRSYQMGETPAWGVVAARRQQPAQQEGGMGGGSWGGAVGGALSGAAAGHMNAINDPNMSNKRDGFGTKYRDSRAEVGGAVLGGVMGYYGLGGMAGPAVQAAHPIMEPTTRWLINTGDSFGGAGGALMMDPIGTVASGKYDGKQLAVGALLGPFSKFVKV